MPLMKVAMGFHYFIITKSLRNRDFLAALIPDSRQWNSSELLTKKILNPTVRMHVDRNTNLRIV